LAISKAKKEELVADYAERLRRSQAVILTDYRGLSVADIQSLRKRLRELDTGYQVAKNTLLRLALQEAGLPAVDHLLEGPTAIGFCYREVTPVARAVVEFSREKESFVIKGGLVGRQTLGPAEVAALADLPSREVLLAHLLGAFQAPIAGLLRVFNGPLQGLMTVLKGRMEQLAPAEG